MNITEPKTELWIMTQLSTPIRGTPAFIVWDVEQNKELDRILGYSDKNYFFFILDKIIEMRKLKNSHEHQLQTRYQWEWVLQD